MIVWGILLKETIERPRVTWEDNIQVDPLIGLEDVDQIDIRQERALVYVLMNFRIP
jgi:hypothetical protein